MKPMANIILTAFLLIGNNARISTHHISVQHCPEALDGGIMQEKEIK